MLNEYELMQELGFTMNEAKIYLVLLKKNPLNGYEVAKEANIARATVYGILDKLVQKKYVAIIDGETTRYAPINYKDIIMRLKNEFTLKLKNMEEFLDNYSQKDISENYVINLSNYSEMVNEIKNNILSAKKEIYISMWSQEAVKFLAELKQANDAGVKIYAFSFTKFPFDFGIQYTYDMDESEIWFPRRRITAVFDRKLIIMGEGNDQINEISIMTKNKMIIQSAIDQMLLDIINLHAMLHNKVIYKGITSKEYDRKTQEYFKSIGVPKDLPQRID